MTCSNPRPCMRGDIVWVIVAPVWKCSNPRPCMRGDKAIACDESAINVPIHAPA